MLIIIIIIIITIIYIAVWVCFNVHINDEIRSCIRRYALDYIVGWILFLQLSVVCPVLHLCTKSGTKLISSSDTAILAFYEGKWIYKALFL